MPWISRIRALKCVKSHSDIKNEILRLHLRNGRFFMIAKRILNKLIAKNRRLRISYLIVALDILRIASDRHDVTHILRNKKKQYVIYISLKMLNDSVEFTMLSIRRKYVSIANIGPLSFEFIHFTRYGHEWKKVTNRIQMLVQISKKDKNSQLWRYHEFTSDEERNFQCELFEKNAKQLNPIRNWSGCHNNKHTLIIIFVFHLIEFDMIYTDIFTRSIIAVRN